MKHGRSWEGATPESNTAWCRVRHPTQLPVRRCRVCFFFFFFFFTVTSTRLLFSPICAKPRRFGQNQAVSAKSGYIGRQPKRIETAEISLESCWNSQNRLWMRPKHPKFVLSQFYSEYLLLLLCFLFCFAFCLCCLPSSFFVLWSRHSNVFFKNILIVKIYRKYK